MELASSQRPQFFFHVPKTGGSTVHAYLVRSFGRDKVISPSKNKTFLSDVWARRKCLSAKPEGLPCVTGHFASLSVIADNESAYHKVCFWRHPADYALSYYNWRRSVEKDRIKRPYSLMHLVGSFAHNPMTQDFLLYCGDVRGWRYFLMSDWRKFEVAIGLASRFDLFADISEVDDYLRRAQLVSDSSVERRNTVSEKAIKALDAHTRRQLEELNPVDHHIHLYCASRDKSAAIADARKVLSRAFPFRDLVRLATRPYCRFWVKVYPRVFAASLP